ncbi:hypothetical protein T492DRAFT_301788 [Pavlovales sp. CCMP2436]|nr:hypothetical protein T492DRAFT_301788 [Pavlovales sp. CCMP2436]
MKYTYTGSGIVQKEEEKRLISNFPYRLFHSFHSRPPVAVSGIGVKINIKNKLVLFTRTQAPSFTRTQAPSSCAARGHLCHTCRVARHRRTKITVFITFPSFQSLLSANASDACLAFCCSVTHGNVVLVSFEKP